MAERSDPASGWKSPFYAGEATSGPAERAATRGFELRESVTSGWALGTFVIDLPDPGTITVLALAGFRFVVLDMEHSPIGFHRLDRLIGACNAAGIACLVRPWGEDTGLIGKILDMGAHGIMAPHVGSPERAREVVDEARYPPVGKRGFSPLTRFDGLETPIDTLNQSTYVVAQIEGRSALERVDEIASVPGLDALFVGPYDLSLSLGVEPGSDAVVDAAQEIAAAVPDSLGLGIYIDDPRRCAFWAERRFALQCVCYDGRMLADSARAMASRARRDIPGESEP